MDIGEKLHLKTPEEWRDWLAEHYNNPEEIWLVIEKGASSSRGITMRSAQEEALCFGWVDSVLKPVDAGRYALRFTPRRKGSRWGAANKARALKMLRAGKMTPAGLAQLPAEVIAAWGEENHAKGSTSA